MFYRGTFNAKIFFLLGLIMIEYYQSNGQEIERGNSGLFKSNNSLLQCINPIKGISNNMATIRSLPPVQQKTSTNYFILAGSTCIENTNSLMQPNVKPYRNLYYFKTKEINAISCPNWKAPEYQINYDIPDH